MVKNITMKPMKNNMTAVEELKHIFDDILKDRGVYISWDTYLKQEKQQTIDFATNFARDYIGYNSVCTDVNDLGPAAHYYNQINK